MDLFRLEQNEAWRKHAVSVGVSDACCFCEQASVLFTCKLSSSDIGCHQQDECHLDLHAWMMLFARILGAISGERQYTDTYNNLRKAMFDTFKSPDAPNLLADYISKQPFNASSHATLVVPPWSTNGQCSSRVDCDPYSSNPCCSPSGWCGNSPDHCKCEGCRRSKPLQVSYAPSSRSVSAALLPRRPPPRRSLGTECS